MSRHESQAVQQLYTAKLPVYQAFISFFQSQRAIQALFESCGLLRPGLRVLDAGCGFGTATFALLDASRRADIALRAVDGFDLTPAMLDRFRKELAARGINQVRFQQADVLALEQLPLSWKDYDLIVSTSMLEYVPRQELWLALSALRARLARRGVLLAMVTRRNWMTRILIERWWHANGYTRPELQDALSAAGFEEVKFARFPVRYFWQNFSNHVLTARCQD